jgi:hypothetical protein
MAPLPTAAVEAVLDGVMLPSQAYTSAAVLAGESDRLFARAAGTAWGAPTTSLSRARRSPRTG